MGTCGGAPSSFLCVARRGGGDRGRRDYPARRRVETSPSGRVHLCVILMLFQRFARPEFSGFAEAILCTAKFTASCATRGAPRCLTGKPVKGLGSALAGHDAPG